MEIDAQEVINRLAKRISQLEVDKTLLEVQLEATQSELRAATSSEGPIEGEVVG